MWEIKQRVLVDMAADRGAFIDQSQSFNVHMSDPNFGKLTSLHFYAWKARGPAIGSPGVPSVPCYAAAFSRWPCQRSGVYVMRIRGVEAGGEARRGL